MILDIEATLQQIGTGNLMAIGAHDMLTAPDSLTIGVGAKRGQNAKVIVTLDASDTYSVRRWVMVRRTCQVCEDVTESGVSAEQLGAVVRRMGDR